MEIRCFRCGELLESPDSNNADYIIASDITTIENAPVLVAIHHNAATLRAQAQMKETEEYRDTEKVRIAEPGDSAWEVGEVVLVRQYEAERKKLDVLSLKSPIGETPLTMTRLKYPALEIGEADYTKTVVSSPAAAHAIPNLIRVETDIRAITVQKTAIICPDCYLETDTVIWGVHKDD